MSTTVFDQNFLIGSATGDGYVVRVWAEQEDGAVFWYAQATTQYYDGYIDHYDPDTHQAYRADAGTAASYIKLEVNSTVSNEVKAANGTSRGAYGSWNRGDYRTAHETQDATNVIAVTPPYDRYDVSLIYRGIQTGTEQVQEAVPLLAYVNVSGTVKDVRAVYANISGVVKECVVYTNVNGTIKKIG
ncbi:MAG: hypothetical protein IJT62_04300 [Oscillospiraceae bacterium]|nr:hypothetical protein [Oscillospiraceae bacterium]